MIRRVYTSLRVHRYLRSMEGLAMPNRTKIQTRELESKSTSRSGEITVISQLPIPRTSVGAGGIRIPEGNEGSIDQT